MEKNRVPVGIIVAGGIALIVIIAWFAISRAQDDGNKNLDKAKDTLDSMTTKKK